MAVQRCLTLRSPKHTDRGTIVLLNSGTSPFVPQDHPDRFYQAGIVSWGVGCGKRGVPAVYADVASLRPWIDRQLSKRDINNTYTPKPGDGDS
jgi:hypothetical protein